MNESVVEGSLNVADSEYILRFAGLAKLRWTVVCHLLFLGFDSLSLGRLYKEMLVKTSP